MHANSKRIRMLLTALLLTVRLLVIHFPVAAAQEHPAADGLRILVSTGEEEGNIPLSNIILDIYPAGNEKEGKASDAAVQMYKRSSHLLATLITDETGSAVLDTTGMEQTLLITVQENPAVSGGDLAMFVSGKQRTVKLELLPERAPDLQMDIDTIGQKSATGDMGQAHTWIIGCDIPSGICNAREFTVTDILTPCLDYEAGSVTVTLSCGGEREIPLDNNHYALTEEVHNSNGVPLKMLRISLTAEGMSHIAANLGEGKEQGQLYIRFRTTVNRGAAIGAAIPNDAHLIYRNAAGVTYCADSDIPEVHTGGLAVLKVDPEGTPLMGCDFMLAREAGQAELEDETILKEVLHVGNKNLAVVYVDFYTDAENGGKQYRATTGADGTASMYGLACGTYYLVESAPPEGYDGSVQPIEVEITQHSHLPENAVRVVNGRLHFPQTGGMGTVAFTASGCLLICAACLLLLSNRNRRY